MQVRRYNKTIQYIFHESYSYVRKKLFHVLGDLSSELEDLLSLMRSRSAKKTVVAWQNLAPEPSSKPSGVFEATQRSSGSERKVRSVPTQPSSSSPTPPRSSTTGDQASRTTAAANLSAWNSVARG